MIKQTTLGIALSTALLAGCAANTTAQRTTAAAGTTSCASLGDVNAQVSDLYANKVTSVQPVHDTKFIARAIQPRYVAGAELHVAGERGLNEPYLERLMTCHANSSAVAAHPNDPARVSGVERIDVVAAGSSYRIMLTSSDRSVGKAIWQSAQQLQGDSSVEVRQLAAVTDASAL